MTIKVLDGSNYFRGLLLLIKKDNRVAGPEADLMKRIGKALGFEAEFCSNAIKEILHNEHVSESPPQFSSQELAMKFIHDGLTIAMSDGNIDTREEEWLRTTALTNKLDDHWFDDQLADTRRTSSLAAALQAENLRVTHM